MSLEDQVIATLVDEVAAVIRSKCSCRYPSSRIVEATLLCHDAQVDSSAHEAPTGTSYVTFRAKLLSVEKHSPVSLVKFIETWVAEAPLLRILERTDSSFDIKLSPLCPARLKRRGEPLCAVGTNGSTNIQPIRVNETDRHLDYDCVSIPIFVASLLAEFLLLLMVFLIGIIVSLLIVYRRERRK